MLYSNTIRNNKVCMYTGNLNSDANYVSEASFATRKSNNNLSVPIEITLSAGPINLDCGKIYSATNICHTVGWKLAKVFDTFKWNSNAGATFPARSYACPKATPLHAWLDIRSKVRVSPIFRENFRRGSRLRNPRRFLRGYGTDLLERKIRHGCSIKQTIRRRLGKALPDKLRAIKLPSPPSRPALFLDSVYLNKTPRKRNVI